MRDREDKKREELNKLQQEVESHRNTELQEVELQEELSRRRQERSSLQEQCKHLEARRRHADRSLSVVETELTKQREELSHAQLLQQEVVRDVTASQEQLSEEELWQREKQLTQKEELLQEGEELVEMEEELRVKEDEIKKTDKEEESGGLPVYDGLRSAFTCEEKWEVET
ncbi:trichohyalin [Cyclopterus lumpus]|uniref:trichohyalin n=1 Tax=Cyclopterus lumpus TaxID=8103 RepID=UPI001486B3CB|nr:trichohyalin [Cyclopterus lumpus]